MTVIQSESIVMFYLFLILYKFNGEIGVKSKADPHLKEGRQMGIQKEREQCIITLMC